MNNHVKIQKLATIPLAKGDVRHILKKSDESYNGFGEAYFSWILPNEKKGWKFHKKMTMNLVVPVGRVLFQFTKDIEDQSNLMSTEIGEDNYRLITVKPGLWFSFEGWGESSSLVLNIANIEHDPDESVLYSLSKDT